MNNPFTRPLQTTTPQNNGLQKPIAPNFVQAPQKPRPLSPLAQAISKTPALQSAQPGLLAAQPPPRLVPKPLALKPSAVTLASSTTNATSSESELQKNEVDCAPRSVPSINKKEDADELESQLQGLMRRIVAARTPKGGRPQRKSREEIVHHTSARVKRISQRGLDGEQAWREYRRACGRCSLTDGWYILAEIPEVLLIVLWHRADDNNGYPVGDEENTYVVVDRSKQYDPTESLKYATEIFMFACMKELLTKLSKLSLSGDSQRLARLRKFVRKEKSLVKGQEGRSELDDSADWIMGNFTFSPWEETDLER